MRERAFHVRQALRAAGFTLLLVLPAIFAACGNSGGGSGY
jgi:hypothetical protein